MKYGYGRGTVSLVECSIAKVVLYRVKLSEVEP